MGADFDQEYVILFGCTFDKLENETDIRADATGPGVFQSFSFPVSV